MCFLHSHGYRCLSGTPEDAIGACKRRRPSQKQAYFVENLTRIVDRYFASNERVLITGDFNIEVTDKNLIPLIEAYEFYSLIKKATCFKSKKGRCIDLMLTNRKHSFMKSQSFETGFSDHHHLR